MQRSSQTKGRQILLFGRYPVPGRTKTRLIPLLGPLGAAEFQRRMTEKSLDTLTDSRIAPVTFCYADGRPGQMRRWLKGRPIKCIPQVRGDLGMRMQAAIQSALSLGRGPVLLLGTDIPELTVHHLEQAFDALADHDLVLGPSPDGGYYLVGCRQPVDIFRRIPWGTSRVLAATLDHAGRQGLKVKQLEPLNDIDTPEDLVAWQPQKAQPNPYLSIIIPTLNEAQRIAQTISRVQGPDIEVLVADGGSHDETVAIASRSGAKVIITPPGRAIQQNQGAARATGSVLLFLHTDTRLPKRFGRYVFDCLLDPRVAAGAFRFKTDLNHWGMVWIEKWAHLRSKLLQMPYGDQALFISGEVFSRAGGFPITPIAEDLMLVRRLARLGSIRIVPAAAVTSARRWQRVGLLRTTMINHIIAIGCLLHIAPQRLAPMYHGRRARRDGQQ